MNIISDVTTSSQTPSISDPALVDQTISEALADLERMQEGDGHWVFELEADVTIPAEYIFLNHFLDTIDDAVEQKLANYIRRQQSDKHGGWPLYHEGEFNISASVKGYFALKLVGDDPDEPHMQRARQAILDYGGAERANVFTRFALALFNQTPWHAVPVMRPEAMLLPRWSPFHIEKVSYWSRTVMIPMFVLYSLRAQAANPRGVRIDELFTRPPFEINDYNVNPTGSGWGEFFLRLDKVVRFAEPMFPKLLERRGVQKCLKFVKERLNGDDGLGAIFPAMANTVMMYHTLGYPADHPDFVLARRSIDNLLILKEEEGYCQPCVSPIWDTALVAHAVAEATAATSSSGEPDLSTARSACDWLVKRQITEVFGDYAWKKPDLKPGGW
ncbi:MAG: prenyltransferase/squalene oxidase repeat-containing protein, partial [Rhodospirillales bacterium]